MAKFLQSMLLVAASSGLAAPALAAPLTAVGASPPATATAKIVRPLTLTRNTNLDFGTIILKAITQNNTVALDAANNLSCGFVAELVCSGTTVPANFTVTGTNNITVKVYSGPTTLNGSNGGTLTFTPAAPATVALGANGATSGAAFNVGGSIVVGTATVEGIYVGNMDVTVDYN